MVDNGKLKLNLREMKFKFLAILAITGLAFAGCGSNKNDDGSIDSGAVDTNITTSRDTSITDSTMVDTTMAKPIDTARR